MFIAIWRLSSRRCSFSSTFFSLPENYSTLGPGAENQEPNQTSGLRRVSVLDDLTRAAYQWVGFSVIFFL